MKISLIKTETDYDAALAAIERLCGSPEGSLDGDHLEVLLVLIENYETKHHSILPPDPIEAIKFRMEQMNLTRKDIQPKSPF